MKARLPQGFGGGMGDMMKQAKKMQDDMQAFQAEFSQKEFTVAAGGGMATVVMSGDKTLKSIKLKPEVVDPDDVEMLEDIIVAAVNEASRKIDEEQADGMAPITGGLNLPGLF